MNISKAKEKQELPTIRENNSPTTKINHPITTEETDSPIPCAQREPNTQNLEKIWQNNNFLEPSQNLRQEQNQILTDLDLPTNYSSDTKYQNQYPNGANYLPLSNYWTNFNNNCPNPQNFQPFYQQQPPIVPSTNQNSQLYPTEFFQSPYNHSQNNFLTNQGNYYSNQFQNYQQNHAALNHQKIYNSPGLNTFVKEITQNPISQINAFHSQNLRTNTTPREEFVRERYIRQLQFDEPKELSLRTILTVNILAPRNIEYTSVQNNDRTEHHLKCLNCNLQQNSIFNRKTQFNGKH